MALTDQEIAARCVMGNRFVRKFAAIDRLASSKFRDGSNANVVATEREAEEDEDDDEGGDVIDEIPVGQPNHLATNVLIKNSAIAIGDPDFVVTCSNPENARIVREFMRAKWRLYNWVRLTRRVLQKHDLCGLGTLAYRWDAEEGKRSCFDFVHSWDLIIDRAATDLTKLRWGGRKIRMPLRRAMKRYPGKFNVDKDAKAGHIDREKVCISIYHDEQIEAHVHDGKVIFKEENLYGEVPLLFFEGDIDPTTSIWPLGDMQLAAGLQAELSDLHRIISNRAKHGGPLNLVSVAQLDKGGLEAIQNSQEQGHVPVKDLVTAPVVRVPGEELSATLLEAKREARNTYDAVTGVGQYQRGVIDNTAKFATEIAVMQNQSQPRSVMAQKEFERFVRRMAETVVMLERKFGGPRVDEKGEKLTTDEEEILWEAFQDVQEILVIEASTAFKDPNFEIQQSLQLLNVVAQLVPTFMQTGERIPNLEAFLDDHLRAIGKHDTSRYWTMNPAMQQPLLPQGGEQPTQ